MSPLLAVPSWTNEEKRQLFLCWVVFVCLYLCIYGLLLFRFGMDYDEVHEYGVAVTDNYVALGRWGLYAYRYVMGGGTCPWVSGLMAGFAIAAALALQTHLLGLSQWWQRFVYGGMYLGVLQWAFQLRYSVQSDAVGLCFLCMTWAVYMLFKGGSSRLCMVVAALFICLGLSVYQSSVLYLAALVLAMVVASIQKTGQLPRCRVWFQVMGACVLGGCGYYAVHAACLHFFPLSESARSFAQNYFAAQTGGIPEDAGIGETLRIFLHFGLMTPLRTYLESSWPGHWVSLMTAPVALWIVVSLKERTSWAGVCVGGMATFALLMVPYTLSVILLHDYFPVRVYVAESVSTALLWGLLIRDMRGGGMRAGTRLFCCVVACFVVIKSMYGGALLARDEMYYHDRSMEELIAMNARGQQVGLRAGLKDCPIVVVGAVSHPGDQMFSLEENGRYVDAVSPYVFFWKGCMEEYAQFLRLPRLRQGTQVDEEFHREALELMPIWPHDGSVRADKGEVIIRVGKITPAPGESAHSRER